MFSESHKIARDCSTRSDLLIRDSRGDIKYLSGRSAIFFLVATHWPMSIAYQNGGY